MGRLVTTAGWGVIAVVVLAAHVLLVTKGFAAVEPWLGGFAVVAVLALIAVHLAGLRAVLARRAGGRATERSRPR